MYIKFLNRIYLKAHNFWGDKKKIGVTGPCETFRTAKISTKWGCFGGGAGLDAWINTERKRD